MGDIVNWEDLDYRESTGRGDAVRVPPPAVLMSLIIFTLVGLLHSGIVKAIIIIQHQGRLLVNTSTYFIATFYHFTPKKIY